VSISTLRRVLSDLDIAAVPNDMDGLGMRLQPLQSELAGFWSVSVSATGGYSSALLALMYS
jgi:hypothetical protein